jgi:PAS domain-containing protein
VRNPDTADDHPMGVEGQLQVALDNMPGALVYTDDDLHIVVCNERFREMYSVPRELLRAGCPSGRLDYGAIGTVTNLAARLCGEADDGQILISPRIFSKVEAQIEAQPVGERP